GQAGARRCRRLRSPPRIVHASLLSIPWRDKDKDTMRELRVAREDLLQHVRHLIPDGDVDQNQVAANELAWTYARVEAAEACDEWAAATGDRAARQIADAAIDDAFAELGLRPRNVSRQVPFDGRSLADLGATQE